MGTMMCVYVCVHTVCVSSGASPALLACEDPAAVPCAGLHSWGEPWGRAAAWCTSPYPLFLPFPLAGPLSLTAHAITQWHSFIYYCTLTPPSPTTHTHTNASTQTDLHAQSSKHNVMKLCAFHNETNTECPTILTAFDSQPFHCHYMTLSNCSHYCFLI